MISRSLLDRLRAEIGGTVLEPGAAGYRQAATIDNGRIDQPPAAFVLPSGVEDVRRTLLFARDHRLPLTVLSGGHSAAGYCLNRSGLVLDMTSLTAMRLDAKQRVLWMQAGVTWQAVYDLLQASGTGLVPVGGGCLSVGVSGFLLGGGAGFVSRSYGMGIDNLLTMTVVTADGEVRCLSERSTGADADLFWACRGGGGGNFGVAVEMEIRLHRPPSERLLGGVLYYPLERVEEVLGFYNEWITTVPDALAVYGYLGPSPGLPTETVQSIRFEPVYNGPFAEGLELIQPLLRLDPLVTNLYDVDLVSFENIMGMSTEVHQQYAYIRSGTMAAGSLTPEVARTFRDWMTAPPSPASFAIWMHTGGRIATVAPDATAYPHRDAEFVFELKSIWPDQGGTRENVEWGYRFVEELEPHFTGAYVNYIDPLLEGWRERYYGANYARLLDVKRRFDPSGFFDFQQGVGSEFEPPGGEPLDLSPLNRTFLPSPGRDPAASREPPSGSAP